MRNGTAGLSKIKAPFIDDDGASSLPALEGVWGARGQGRPLVCPHMMAARFNRRHLPKINLSRSASAVMLVRKREEELDEVRLVLTASQKVWAVLVALALIAGGIGSCAQGLVAYHDWACRMAYWSVLACAGEMEMELEQLGERSQ